MDQESRITDFAGFEGSLADETPPARWSPALQRLWWDAKGDWRRAHECAQSGEERSCAWVHAHLHRAEGDLANAKYWYGRAGRPVSAAPLAAERQEIFEALIKDIC